METVFATGPGFYCAQDSKHRESVPDGMMRFYCARLEAYDVRLGDASSMELSWTILFAMAEDNPEIARALLDLGKGIEANRANLESIVKG